jgi:predicted murein hydrolase (TIGR00659 family)
MIALAWILLTVALYAASRAIVRRFPSPWLSPLLVVPGVLVVLLLATRTPYPTYLRGGRWLLALLGPTTVAFAVPLHRHRDLIRRYAVELLAGIATGSAVAVVSSAMLSRALGLPRTETLSMLPRSITTPFAMQVATTLGGSPVLAAVFVIVTALVGVVSGRALVSRLPLRSAVARGALLGMGAHGAGTALALELGAVEGAVSGLVMIGAGLLLLLGAPVLHVAIGAA